jgi:hypothetical protein
MAQVLEAVHRPEQAVVVLQNVLKAPHPHQPLQDTPGHQAHISEAAAVALSQPERRKVEGMLAAAQVRWSCWCICEHSYVCVLCASCLEEVEGLHL